MRPRFPLAVKKPMRVAAQLWLCAAGMILGGLASGYAMIAAAAVRLRLPRERAPHAVVPPNMALPATVAPPTTILKPLHGAEPGLYGQLRSFCELGGPALQIVCGVRDPNDPAVAVVRRLQREFPQLELDIAAEPTQHGSSAKVSNLINMLPLARHDYLVIADSDVRVTPGYLERVTLPLLDEGVGVVTCLYHGRPQPGLWSVLGSLFVNEWFTPAVRVAALFGSRTFALGATIALRRETLRRIGGFTAIVNQLPDDYRLGELTRRLGLRTVLCTEEVETSVDEPDFRHLLQHELRWLRTIRTVAPVGYTLAGVTLGWPVAALGAVLARGHPASLVLLAVTVVARLVINSPERKSRSPFAQLWLVALNDLLMLVLWGWSFATRRVHWRHARFRVSRNGTLQPLP
jgi:ceramide glucosyltransferase